MKTPSLFSAALIPETATNNIPAITRTIHTHARFDFNIAFIIVLLSSF
jgi:hypothetical protein